MPRPPSFDERDVSDKPKFVRRRPPLSREDLTQIERDYRCGLAALLALDDAVGRIVSRLEATGQLANTVLIFLTDQGVMAGEHRIKRGKNRPYEEAIRVPLLMRGPSIAAGAQVEAPVANADLAPTMLEIAGAPIPPELARPIDGVSLASVLSGAPDDRRRAVPIEGRDNVSGSRRGSRSAPTSACAPPATRTSSIAAPASTPAPRASTPRSARAGRPSASSTTSSATPTSYATATATPRTRTPAGGWRTRLARSSGARAPSARWTSRSPGRRAGRVSVDGRGMAAGRIRVTIRRTVAATSALAALIAGTVVLGGDERASSAPVRPSIVLISTDDQTLASLAAMPQTRRLLVDEGATFENNIASFPLCCPSRATWITGEYAHNHGVIDNQERNGGGYESLRDPDRVLPAWLDAAGYDTALAGKWLHDYRTLRPAPGWDRFWA